MSGGRAASLRVKLLALAKARGEDFSLVLNRYATERFLYRLSRSPERERFWLKGALVMQTWFAVPHRPTRDADFLGFGPADAGALRETIAAICGIAADDGMAFAADEISVEEIREEARYGGLRARLTGDLDGATPAEMKALVGKMLELRAILKASPVAGQPVGYNTLLTGHFEEMNEPERPELKPRDFPLRGLIWFGAFPQEFDEKGKLLPTIGETTLMGFWVNSLPHWVDQPAEWRDQLTDAVLHPRHYPELDGLPHFGGLLVVKKNNRPLWVPVNFEDSLALTLAHRRKAVAGYESKAAELRRDYADYITPKRRAERLEMYRLAAKPQKDLAAFMAQMAKLDRDTEEIRRKQAEAMTPAGASYWADAIARVKEAEADFASLSPEQKAAPACYLDQANGPHPDTRPLASFVPAGTPKCRPIIRPNWNYFDRSLPRTAIQLITVEVNDCPGQKPPADGNPAGCPANLALVHSLDWEKVKALMGQ